MPRPVTEVVGYAWHEFLDVFTGPRGKWKPGEHFSLAALTGAGKSTFMAGLLGAPPPRGRKYVLALDIKGGDEILGSLGWQRLPDWPGIRKMARMVRDNDEHGRPSRYIVGQTVTQERDRARLRNTITEALRDAFAMGGWTIYIDELQVAADRRMMNLEGQIASLLVSARQPKRITIASSFQAPAWVPSEAVRQPVWFGVSQTRDEQVVQRLAEVMGRDVHELIGAMRGLEEHAFLIVDRNPYSPLLATMPRRLA